MKKLMMAKERKYFQDIIIEMQDLHVFFSIQVF
jgi:hypothetical protein